MFSSLGFGIKGSRHFVLFLDPIVSYLDEKVGAGMISWQDVIA